MLMINNIVFYLIHYLLLLNNQYSKMQNHNNILNHLNYILYFMNPHIVNNTVIFII